VFHHIFPGAKALRVVSAYQIFLAMPVVLLAVKFLSTRRFAPIISIPIAALLLIAELNVPSLGLNREAEMKRVSLVQKVPSACKAFYVSGWNEQDQPTGTQYHANTYPHNVSAMLIAQLARIPTINGISSFDPPDWNFGNPYHKDYDLRMVNYGHNHNVKGLCKYDLNKKEWGSPIY
jgi:hypothetical protein